MAFFIIDQYSILSFVRTTKNNNMKRYLPFILPLLIVLSACSAGKRAFEKGDYERAVYNSVNRLRSGPDSRKARETLKQAYPQMVAYYQDRIDILKRSSEPYRWERIMDDYHALNKVYDEIQRSPSALRALPNVKNFQNEYNDATLKAADVRYTMGSQALEAARQGDREQAKMAYDHFRRALSIRAGFRDAEMRSRTLQRSTYSSRPFPCIRAPSNLATSSSKPSSANTSAVRSSVPLSAFTARKKRAPFPGSPTSGSG